MSALQSVTILGCGTSTGVPLIQCQCPVCTSPNLKNKRLRASIWLTIKKNNGSQVSSILIDTSPDFRQQALRENIKRIDAVLYTHPHADHCHGIDELRSFNYIQNSPIPLYGNDWTVQELSKKFSYVFQQNQKSVGGGAPQLILNQFDPNQPLLLAEGHSFIPLPVSHGARECIGYRFNQMAYITDVSLIPEETFKKLEGLEILILDCVRFSPHQTHFNLDQALQTIDRLKPKESYLTHLGHDFNYEDESSLLPKDVYFAYDGLKINF